MDLIKSKLKEYFLGVLLVVFCHNIEAQEYEYVPMPIKNAIWSELFIDYNPIVYYNIFNLKYAIFNSDTVMYDLVWHKLYRLKDSTNTLENSEPYGFITEESKMVYYIGPHAGGLMYNFNANVNEKVEVTVPIQAFYIIKKIDSIEIKGKLRKRFYLWSQSGFFDTGIRWIEGIGSTNGLLWPGDYSLNDKHELICLNEEYGLTYLNEAYNSCYLDFPNGAISIQKNNDNLFKIYPNPIRDYIFIEFQEFETGQLFINSIDGRIIKKWEVIKAKNQKLNLQFLENGIYIINFVNRQNEFFQKKLIINK